MNPEEPEFKVGDLVKILYDPMEYQLGVVVGSPVYDNDGDLLSYPVYCQNGRTNLFVNEELMKVA